MEIVVKHLCKPLGHKALLRDLSFSGAAGALGAECMTGGSMTAFELACDNAVNTYLRGAKLISYGAEPVLAYMAAVEGEITAIRMILTGRLAGIAPQVIRERLRDMYA